MSDSHQQPDRHRLDEYLDGTLAEPLRAEVGREIAHDPALQAEVELQRKVDAALVERFQPPTSVPGWIATLPAAAAAPATVPLPRRGRRFAIAASVAAAAAIWGVIGWYFLGGLMAGHGPQLPLAVIYQQTLDDGFEPTWVCKDDHTFASTFFRRQGQGLLLSEMPKGTKMVGLSYRQGLSKDTTSMLARVDRTPVMVFVDRAADDTHPAEPDAASGLHLFRKELGPLVLYEISPLTHPTASEYLYLADVPSPGK